MTEVALLLQQMARLAHSAVFMPVALSPCLDAKQRAFLAGNTSDASIAEPRLLRNRRKWWN